MTCQAARGTAQPQALYRVVHRRGAWVQMVRVVAANSPQDAREAAWRAILATDGASPDWTWAATWKVEP